MSSALTSEERDFLIEAALYLERPSLLLRLAETIGKPLELLGNYAPAQVTHVVNLALQRSLALAIATLKQPEQLELRGHSARRFTFNGPLWHNLAGAVSGAGGGFFGLPGLAVDLPITTTIMLRAIADQAQRRGELLDQPEVQMQCLTVFSLGGGQRSPAASAVESSYFTTRVGLQEAVAAATRFAAKVTTDELARMIRQGTAPVLVQLIGRVAAGFNLAISQKLIAQSVPLVGAAGGAAVNVAFIDHFSRVANYHFGIRELERKYGNERIQTIYQAAVEVA